MGSISVFFQANMDLVYFVYGTVLMTMGLTIMLVPKKHAILPLAGGLATLGWIGVALALNQYLDMWQLIRRPHGALGPLKTLIFLASYVLLLEFGRRSLRATAEALPDRLAASVRRIGWQATAGLGLLTVLLAAATTSFLGNILSVSRYVLVFPGTMLAGAAFIAFAGFRSAELDVLSARKYFFMAGAGFAAYGLLGGLVPPQGGYFPASFLNEATFLAAVGIPIQLFRIFCALAISWGVIGALHAYSGERDEIIEGVVFNNSKDCIAHIGLDGNFLTVNKACLGAYFHAPSTVRENARGFMEAVSNAAKGAASTLQYSSYGRAGREIWWDAVMSPVLGRGEKVESIICVARDVTLQRRDQERLRRQHEAQGINTEILGLAVENVSLEEILLRVLDRILAVPWLGLQKKGAILLTDFTGKDLTVKAERGLPGRLGRACSEAPSRHCLCGATALSGEAALEAGGSGRRGDRQGHFCLPIKLQNRMEGVLALYVRGEYSEEEGARDFLDTICVVIAKIVEFKELEVRVQKMQKLEALGRTAGAIAHDFNNILTSMKGFCTLAQETLPAGSKPHGYVKEVAASIERGWALVQQILAFSRSQPAEMSQLDLNSVLTGMEGILLMTVGRPVRLRLDLAPGLPKMTGNKNQLEQIVMNLAVNARDAMSGGGELSIVTRVKGQEDDRSCAAGLGPEVKVVELTVSDTGGGIPDNVKDRIFEPFFTTKPEGKGTGLGLSTVYALVKLHKGEINVVSRPGTGTSFDICFPALGAAPQRDEEAELVVRV